MNHASAWPTGAQFSGDAGDGFGPEGIAIMRELLFILGLGLLVMWDMTQNHGRLLDALASIIRQLLGLVGLG